MSVAAWVIFCLWRACTCIYNSTKMLRRKPGKLDCWKVIGRWYWNLQQCIKLLLQNITWPMQSAYLKKTLTSFYILLVFTLYFGFVLTKKFFVLILNSTPRIKMEIRSFFRDSSNFTGKVCKKYVESLPTLKNTSEEQQMWAHEGPAHTLPVNPLSKYCSSIYLLCVRNYGVF